MSSNKHPKTNQERAEGPGADVPRPPSDEERNPGIGSSKGLFARAGGQDEDLIEGDNTFEGDTDNDGGNAGGISLEEGRTNE